MLAWEGRDFHRGHLTMLKRRGVEGNVEATGLKNAQESAASLLSQKKGTAPPKGNIDAEMKGCQVGEEIRLSHFWG